MFTVTAEARHKIDAYLTNLRSRLRGVDEQDIRDIIEELRSHIIDKTKMAGEDHSGMRIGDVNHAFCALVCASLSALAYAAPLNQRRPEKL